MTIEHAIKTGTWVKYFLLSDGKKVYFNDPEYNDYYDKWLKNKLTANLVFCPTELT
jgi:hypothetical protein